MNELREKILHPTTSPTVINFIASAFLVCFANGSFWNEVTVKLGMTTPNQWLFSLILGLSLFTIFNILFSIFSLKAIYKPFLIIIFCTAAISSYFMGSYGIVIDKQMITNLIETDVREASEQITWQLFRHFVLLGILPSIILLKTKVIYRPWRHELLTRCIVLLISTLFLFAMVMAFFKDFAIFGRENKIVRMYTNPTYPIYSLFRALQKNTPTKTAVPPKVIAADAKRVIATGPKAVILVVGETARAEEFSLNGYQRNTNPRLAEQNIINFTDVQSCGTDTAESLPCMFYHLGKSSYSRDEAKKYENMLDILQRTGVQVSWLDNNSGSKGVADRVKFEDRTNVKGSQFCSNNECYDEILLDGLEAQLSQNRGDMLIVLHQKGSHGPSYYKRSPSKFKKFLPECTKDNVQDCDRQSIINAYDNTILYTDTVLAQIIDILKKQNYGTAMLYVSDHGESLGENNIYLHGLPYSIAPKQQTHVPMIFWASKSFIQDNALDTTFLTKHRTDSFSHDYLFHSILGLFKINTVLYRPELDIFQQAKTNAK